MLLLVGLGNPGAEYARNRHNIGFMVIEALVSHYRLSTKKKRFQGITNEGTIAGEKVLALRPQTYMNESGRSVGGAAHFFKLTPDQVFVFHDEIDLEFGKVRVKTGGGAAGHNGIKSITQQMGPDFHRIRLGVGHPGGEGRVHGHVLGDFGKDEMKTVEEMVDVAVRNVDLLIKQDFAGYMNKFALAFVPQRNEGKKRRGGDED